MSEPGTEPSVAATLSEWFTNTEPCSALPTTLSSSQMGEWQRSLLPSERRCFWCREPLTGRAKYGEGGAQRFCCKEHGTLGRTISPEARAVWAEKARVLGLSNRGNTLPGVAEHMRRNNPMRNESSREKMRATLIGMGHRPSVRGGNGSGMTEPQTILLDRLGTGWVAEHAVSCGAGSRARGMPTHYKIDVAHPALRIAVEVDGVSHSSIARRESDARKDSFLLSLGWSVSRFSNQEILTGLESVVERITSIPSK